MFFQWTYLLLPPAVGEMQRRYPDSIVQPRKLMFWPQHGHSVMFKLSVALELQIMCQGRASQPAWSLYSECVREVLLRRPGECTANMLGKCSSSGLENVQRTSLGSSPSVSWRMYSECVSEMLLKRPGEFTTNVVRKFFSSGLENVRRMCQGSVPQIAWRIYS